MQNTVLFQSGSPCQLNQFEFNAFLISINVTQTDEPAII